MLGIWLAATGLQLARGVLGLPDNGAGRVHNIQAGIMRLTKLRAVGPSPIARGVAQMPRQVWRTICRIPMRRHATGGPYAARVAFAVMAYFRSADVRPSNSVYADPIAFIHAGTIKHADAVR